MLVMSTFYGQFWSDLRSPLMQRLLAARLPTPKKHPGSHCDPEARYTRCALDNTVYRMRVELLIGEEDG